MSEQRIGLDPEFGSPYEYRLDVLVPASPDRVARIAATRGEDFKVDALDIVTSPSEDDDPIMTVFQLPGHTWTQVLATRVPRGSMRLGHTLSRELQTRALHVELSDDVWGGYVLFDKGDVVEIAWRCVNDDLLRLGRDLGLDIPAFDEDAQYDDVDYFFSTLPGRSADDLPGMLQHLGAWLDGDASSADAGGERSYLIPRDEPGG